MNTPSFDRLVSVYRLLEFAAFGRDLERARFAFLDRLARSRRILVLGEGDGRCLARLVSIASGASIHCVDISAAMLERAAARLPPADRARVVFHQMDAMSAPLPDGPFDAVTTMFFLDCFTEAQLGPLVRAIAARLDPGALWLWSDFRMPEHGWAHLRAQAWVGLLYWFFRWQTGIAARELPPAERAIVAAGLEPAGCRDFQDGMVRARLFVAPGAAAATIGT